MKRRPGVAAAEKYSNMVIIFLVLILMFSSMVYVSHVHLDVSNTSAKELVINSVTTVNIPRNSISIPAALVSTAKVTFLFMSVFTEPRV